MRTTLTLDDDVAAAIERLRRQRGGSHKELVNEALRAGLERLQEDRPPRAPFVQETLSVGRLRLQSLDDIGEVLALVEGEDHR
ncbi:MAG TPA: CopG family transcriptional regulator [Thermoanaerobaculia bacterium]|nr:CopG family transcriptional regulator [Thermoanaerobaculia bacterium]